MKYKEFNEKFFIKKIISESYFTQILVKINCCPEHKKLFDNHKKNADCCDKNFQNQVIECANFRNINDEVIKCSAKNKEGTCSATNEEVSTNEAINDCSGIEEIGKLNNIKLDVSGVNHYDLIGLDPTNLLDKDLIGGWKETEEKGLNGVKKKIKIPILTKEAEEISRAIKRASIKLHPDKNGNTDEANERFKQIGQSKFVIGTHFKHEVINKIKKEYDKYYREEIINDVADDNFKDLVKQRLEHLSKKTDPTSGDLGAGTDDASGPSNKEEKDISKFKHLFPSQTFIDNEINNSNSKKEINRFANGVIYIYMSLHKFDLELKGKGSLNKKRTINKAELGIYQNFTDEVYNKESKSEIDNYLDEVTNTIQKVLVESGGTSEELAHNINIQKLHNLPGWETLEGEDNLQLTEKFHFCQGYRKHERGVMMIRNDNPEDMMYQEIIKRAGVFIKFKKNVQDKWKELKSKEWWSKLPNWSQKEFENKILDLGKLEMVEEKEENSFGVLVTRDKYTKMKFNAYEFDDLKRKIKDIFDEAKAESDKYKEKDPKDKEKEAKQNAIREVELALNKAGLNWNEVWRDSNWKVNYFSDIKEINSNKEKLLNAIYRKVARKEIIKELTSRGFTLDILGINVNDQSELTKYFTKFDGKTTIQKEKQRLLDSIKNKKDRTQEIEDNIKEIQQFLQEKGVGAEQEEKILGNSWKDAYRHMRYDESGAITKTKNDIILAIKTQIEKELNEIKDIIAEIEGMLKNRDLSESILGENWRNNFKGKSQNQIIAEKGRLIALIEKEIDQKGKDNEWSDNKVQQEKEKLTSEVSSSTQKKVKSKLSEGHQKLAVKEEELSELLHPHKSIEEKINSFQSTEEIINFENNLSKAIDNKKKEKLQVFINNSVQEIEEQTKGTDIQLGINSDFKKVLEGMVNPDEIEKYKTKILKLIEQQKSESNEKVDNNDSSLSKKPPISLVKVLGIAALIILPVIVVAIIVLKSRNRRLKNNKE